MKTKYVKQQEASERQNARNSRSNTEQIQLLDSRLGKGAGAKKERARLNVKISTIPNK